MPDSCVLDKIIQRGELRVAARWDLTFEQFINPHTGKPDGVVGRVGQLMAQELGVRVEFVVLEWEDQLDALVEGRVDLLMKHTNLPRRALSVMFSDGALLEYEGVVLVRKESAARGLEWLRGRRRLAGVAGALQEDIIRQRFPNARYVPVPDNDEGAARVIDGSADGLLVDAGLHVPEACDYLTEASGDRVVLSRDASHPAVANGQFRFLRWVDNFMDFHKRLGTLDQIISAAKAAHLEARLSGGSARALILVTWLAIDASLLLNWSWPAIVPPCSTQRVSKARQ